MINSWKTIIWQQFGASIDTLKNSITNCPDDIWGDKPGFYEYWYIAYHTIFFLDFYMSETDKNFAPPKPFTLSELDPSGALPERVYTKEELLTFLEHGRNKSKANIKALTEESAHKRCNFERPDVTVAELLLYTMRHLQHHAAQLNHILRYKADISSRWVFKPKDSLDD
jgi:hypothetical protein